MLKKSGLIFKSPVATELRKRRLGSLIMSGQQRVHAIVLHKGPFLSVTIRIHVIHPNNTVSSVNEHC